MLESFVGLYMITLSDKRANGVLYSVYKSNWDLEYGTGLQKVYDRLCCSVLYANAYILLLVFYRS